MTTEFIVYPGIDIAIPGKYVYWIDNHNVHLPFMRICLDPNFEQYLNDNNVKMTIADRLIKHLKLEKYTNEFVSAKTIVPDVIVSLLTKEDVVKLKMFL